MFRQEKSTNTNPVYEVIIPIELTTDFIPSSKNKLISGHMQTLALRH
jgi:hypothetical protein